MYLARLSFCMIQNQNSVRLQNNEKVLILLLAEDVFRDQIATNEKSGEHFFFKFFFFLLFNNYNEYEFRWYISPFSDSDFEGE